MNGKLTNIAKISSGFALAALLAIILYKVLTNDLSHIGEYIQENTKVMTEVKGGMEANTKATERLEDAITELGKKL